MMDKAIPGFIQVPSIAAYAEAMGLDVGALIADMRAMDKCYVEHVCQRMKDESERRRKEEERRARRKR